jgi:hypothetical protein
MKNNFTGIPQFGQLIHPGGGSGEKYKVLVRYDFKYNDEGLIVRHLPRSIKAILRRY